MAGSIGDFFDSMGKITRNQLYFILALAIIATLGLVHPMNYILDWGLVWERFEIWRPITAMYFWGVFAPPGAFATLINIYIWQMYSSRLEKEEFENQPATHIWMIVVIALILWVLSFFVGMKLISSAYLMSLVWIWSRRNPDMPLSIMGMFSVQAIYFPLVLAVFHLVFGGDFKQDVCGMLAGHFYIFCTDILPLTNGISILKTPQFMLNNFPEGRKSGGSVRFETRAPPPTHAWGRGRSMTE
eukprot:TRINITY_DN84983_c0_g1_i1.p1 TRINITY_DN84983_c0_g1~~TRINITY_DN84983_c0_g1_i1.p1  ORF type:complete len:261 (+),score=25.77 TRINITY_DN84983_c0_g1_i1:57-785(+)